MSGPLEEGLQRHLRPGQLARLAAARVGIAGAGGLGSNCAFLLTRCGIRNFIIVDHDRVEASNLNRQHYFPQHLGQYKVDALCGQLAALADVRADARHVKLDELNILEILPLAPIWVEALDDAETKRSFVEAALRAGVFCVSASGLAGWGGPPMRRHEIKARDGTSRLILVGDFQSAACPERPVLAPRVMQAAAMQADAVIEYLLEGSSRKPSEAADF